MFACPVSDASGNDPSFENTRQPADHSPSMKPLLPHLFAWSGLFSAAACAADWHLIRQRDPAAAAEALAIVQNPNVNIAVLLAVASRSDPTQLRKPTLISLMSYNREETGVRVSAYQARPLPR